MSAGSFKGKVEALSGEHSLDVIVFLRKNGWSIALDIAKGLDIHSTTAMKYLSKMHKAGLISRRVKRCRTGNTYEYKLKSHRIEISLDLASEKNHNKNVTPTMVLILRITEELEKIGNPVGSDLFKDKLEIEVFTLITSRNEQEYASLEHEKSVVLLKVLKRLIEYTEKSLGKPLTRDILISASRSLPASIFEFMPDYVQEVIT